MTPIDFSRRYEVDERSIRGGYYSSAPLTVDEGERVGVVLMNLGGPDRLEDVQPFLYHLLMDPAVQDLPVGRIFRHWLCTVLSWLRAPSVKDAYELIGGSSPLTRLTGEQAESLERHLNDRFGDPTGVNFRTYAAMRYWHPFSEEAIAQMRSDEVDRVVLLPLYPQYSASTSGSALAYWKHLEKEGEIPSWPTTTVLEYAANPKYVQALSERIDEGLQRFPRDRRGEVQLLFSALGTPSRGRNDARDPYCCLVHSTVDEVMKHRDRDRPFHTAFQSIVGLKNRRSPSIRQKLESLAEDDVDAVLVVPVAYVTDHVKTSYDLDIEVREWAETVGIPHYEVSSGLNTHPLFIEALGEAVVAQLDLPVDVNQLRIGGDGLSQDYPLRPIQELPRHSADERDCRCPHCEVHVEARRWTVVEDVPDSGAVEAGEDSGT